MVNKLPFAPLIDVSVYSSLVGIQKPDPRIYQLAVEQLAVEPKDCLYIGDGDSQELTGASKVGMQPVLLRLPNEDDTDVHRVDTERDVWDGPIISSLTEIVTLIERLQK
jgi:putative hydrolase of the HAD superfamily